MVQTYKKYGATADGYRGSRAILKERVIEGLELSDFSNSVLNLTADSPKTIYLTDTNFGEGFYIILPDTDTLWENWQVSIINESSHDCKIYYYTSDLSQLNLFKEVTASNMITCIFLNNNPQNTGKWTTLRTVETSSADNLNKYISDVLESTNIGYGQVLNEDDDTVTISLGNVLAGTSLKSVYVKTTEAFIPEQGETLTLTLDIGTSDDTDKFISGYDLTAAVSDTNFTKDLFDEILSTSSNTEILATFSGSGLDKITSGSVLITVEKPKEIDPTVLRNPIVQTQVPLGVIMSYGFNDIPEGYWRLDGTVIPNATTAIPEFVAKLNKVNNELVGEKLIITNSQWMNFNNTYGSCGKFAWTSNGGLRFPKITNFIQGLTDMNQLGKLIEATDINKPHYHVAGNFNWGTNNGDFTTKSSWVTANMPDGGGTTNWNGSGNGGGHTNRSTVTGNQITSYQVADSSITKIQPESIRYPYIISIYNKIQDAANLDLQEIIEDSVNKANINLDNLDFNNIDSTSKSIITSWGLPDYETGITFNPNTSIQVPYDSIVYWTTGGFHETRYFWISKTGSFSGEELIFAYYNNPDGWQTMTFFVPKGWYFKTSYNAIGEAASTSQYFKLKGAN